MPRSWGQSHQGAGRLGVLRMSVPCSRDPFWNKPVTSASETPDYTKLEIRVFSLSLFFFIQTENLGKSPKALETAGISSPAVPVTREDLTLNKRGP